MKAIILAGGKSSVSTGPISNVDIAGQRLIDIQISCLRNSGVEDIVLVAGYRAEQIERADVEIRHNKAWDSTGSLYSLKAVSDLFDGSSDILVVYGDTIFEPDVIRASLRSPSAIAPVCFLDRSERDKGRYREYAIIEDGVLRRVTSSPNSHGVRTVFTGILSIKATKAHTVQAYLNAEHYKRQDHLGSLIADVCDKGVDLFPVLIEHGWSEIVSDEAYQQTLANTVFIEKIVQIHTDWTKRAELYNRLDWVSNDALLSGITSMSVAYKPRRVLDVGTGTGKVLQALRACMPESECWGIDYSQSMLDRITDRATFTLRCADAETMDGVPDNYFDLVTARMVFHHINSIDRAMQSIARVLRNRGHFLVCEGVPPSLRAVKWYTEMFRFKEDRKTLTEVDLIGMLIRGGFSNIETRTVVLRRCSLNNWLDNSGIPEENIRIIKKMHHEAPDYIKEDYDMEFTGGDCVMTWRFAITSGRLDRDDVAGALRHEGP